jgi:hypothetical protein
VFNRAVLDDAKLLRCACQQQACAPENHSCQAAVSDALPLSPLPSTTPANNSPRACQQPYEEEHNKHAHSHHCLHKLSTLLLVSKHLHLVVMA